jgi:hypothetical protein
MSSLHPYFIPVFSEDDEFFVRRECALDGRNYDERQMIEDNNPHPSVRIYKGNIEAYRDKMTKELELNEPYKF